MKPKTLVLMGVAIACGLGASYMTSRLLAERNSDDEPKIEVLVAKKSLNIGDTIKSPEEAFQVKRFHRDDAPMGAVTDMNDLKNRVLKKPLRVGDHVTPEDLLSDSDVGGFAMPIVLPAGYRAVGVKVNLESGAFGWATLPLARVDVISTIRRADDKASHSRVLLEDVLVLAADDRMRRDENGKAMPSQIVTLALKPEDVLKVRLAGEMGPLSLALRKINDKSRVENPTLSFHDLKLGQSGQVIDDVAETKPEVATKPDVAPPVTTVVQGKPVAELPNQTKPAPAAPKEVLTKFVTTVSEGGKTRFFVYYLNEAGQVVMPNAEEKTAIEQHPPRPPEPAPAPPAVVPSTPSAAVPDSPVPETEVVPDSNKK